VNPPSKPDLTKSPISQVAPDKAATADSPLRPPSVRERKDENTEHANKLLELLKSLESPRGDPVIPTTTEGHDSSAPLRRLNAVPALPTASVIELNERGEKRIAARTDSHIHSARTKRSSPGSASSDTRDGKRIATSSSPRRSTIVDEKPKGTRFQQGSFRPTPPRTVDVDRPEPKVRFEEKRKPLLQRNHARTTLNKFSAPAESPMSSPTTSPRKPSRFERLLPRLSDNSPHERTFPNSSHQSDKQKKAIRRASLPDRSRTEGKPTLQDGVIKRINKSLSPRKHGDVDGTELRPKSHAQPEETIQQLKAEARFWQDTYADVLKENDQLKQRVRKLEQQIEILLAEQNEKQ
jgi:hypothetical protein